MQYHHIQTLVKHLFDKDSFEQVSVQELKQFTDDYPFAAVGQFLYAKKLKDEGSYNHYEQSGQASLYFNNALWLRWLLNHKEEAPPVPVRSEEPAQQPGFRIVVQMPKTPLSAAPPDASPGNELPKEEAATTAPVTTATDENKPAAEVAPVNAVRGPIDGQEPNVVAEPEKPVTTATHSETEKPNEAAPANTTEVTSAVAIAETSQLAEESKVEAAVNAVSITEEALPAGGTVTSPAPDTVTEEQQAAIGDQAVSSSANVETFPSENTTPVEQPIQTTEPVAKSPAGPAQPAPAQIPVTTEPATPVEATPSAEKPAITEPVAQAPETAFETVPAVDDKIKAEQAPPPPVPFPPPGQEAKTTIDLGEPIFESYHTIDYFASQGIKLQQADFKDKLGKQLKSFTDWLRTMKRIGPIETTSLDDVTNKNIQRIAEHSVEEKEVVTEAMAEVWVKQGHIEKAIRLYEKLSLLNPAKSPYFAGRIEQLKAL